MTDRKAAPATGRYLRQREILQLVGVSRPTLWDWRRKGLFPQPRRLGPNTIGWLESEVQEWLQTRPAVG